MLTVFRRPLSQPQGVARLDIGNPLSRGIAAWQTGVDLNGFTSVDIGSGPAPVVPTIKGVARSYSYDASVGLFQWLLRTAAVIQPITSTIVCLARVNADYVQTNGGGTFGLAGLTRSAGGLNAIFLSGTNDGTTSQYEFNVYATTPSPTSLRTLVSTIPVDSDWHLFIGRNTSATSRDFWIDGRLQASDTVSSQPYQPNQFNIGSIGNLNRFGNGDVALTLFYNRALTNAEIASISRNPWQIFAPQREYIPLQVSAAALTLTADSGTYSITGQAANLYYNRAISADAGAYSLNGQAAQTLRAAFLSLDAGSYAITGQDASFVYGQAISADAGDYSITGQIADLTRAVVLSADSGAYSIAGQDANLSRSLYLNAELGSYVITGENATLVYEQARVINGDAGSYAITGQAADLTRTYVFGADAGSYSISGQDADFALFRALSLDAGSYDILGQDADLLLSRSIDADFGVYNISGQNADLLSNRILYADAGSYGISGQDALLAQGRYLLAESGSYAIIGQPATLNSIVLFPNPADVRAGVVYGPDGIYTGTLVASTPIYLFDD